MKLTMIKKNPPFSSNIKFWRHFKVDIFKDEKDINKVFHQMYLHKEQADHFIITFGFNNTMIVNPEDLI